MSHEFPKTPNSHEVLATKLQIQIELIKIFTHEENPSDEKAFGWIEVYSKPFAKLYEQKLQENPDFLDTYKSNKEEVLLFFIEELRKIGLSGGEYKTAA